MFKMSMHKNYIFVKYAFYYPACLAEGYTGVMEILIRTKAGDLLKFLQFIKTKNDTSSSHKHFSNIYTFLPTRILNKQYWKLNCPHLGHIKCKFDIFEYLHVI